MTWVAAGLVLLVAIAWLAFGIDGTAWWRRHRDDIVRDLFVALTAGAVVSVPIFVATAFLDRRQTSRQETLESARTEREEVLENVRFVRDRAADPNGSKPFGGLNLRGAPLAGLDLQCTTVELPGDIKPRQRCADFREADLQKADLRGADLRGADLVGADLRGAQMSVANLAGARFIDADLRGADLTAADLERADLYNADLAVQSSSTRTCAARTCARRT